MSEPRLSKIFEGNFSKSKSFFWEVCAGLLGLHVLFLGLLGYFLDGIPLYAAVLHGGAIFLVGFLAFLRLQEFKTVLYFFWGFLLFYALPFSFFLEFLRHSELALCQFFAFFSLMLAVLLFSSGVILPALIFGCCLAYVVYLLVNPVLKAQNGLWMVLGGYFMVGSYAAYFEKIKSDKSYQEKSKFELLGRSIAHELKTPLTTIALSVGSLKEGLWALSSAMSDIDEKRIAQLGNTAKRIEYAARQSLLSIDLILSQMREADSFGSMKEVIPISECIESALSEYPFQEKAQAMVRYKLREDFQFLGNKRLMTLVLLNLIRNSLFFARVGGGGAISVNVYLSKNKGVVEYEDTFAGMSEKVRSRIFSGIYTTKEGGNGIGLLFCKHVIEAFGGEIACVSEEGAYTRFVIHLPLFELKDKKGL